MNNLSRRSWLAVIACAIATFNSGALFFGYPGLMTPYWQELFHADSGQTGFIMTFACLGVGCVMLLSGYLHPKLGTRRCLVCGTVLLILCMVLANLASNLSQIYLWAFLNGGGTGMIYGPCITTVQHWLPQRRGLSTGVVNLAFGTSAAIMSPVYNLLFIHFGYQTMNWIVLTMLLVLNCISFLFAELPSFSRLNDQMRTELESQKLAGRQSGPALAARSMTVKEALCTKSFWAIWLTWCFMGAAGISMVSLATTYAASIQVAGVVVLTAFNLTNGISRIVAGTLSDLIGRNLTSCTAFLLGGLGYILLPFCHSPLIISILAAFVGFAFGTLFSASAPLVSDLFGLSHYSTIFSMVFSAYGILGGIVGPALSGKILTYSGGNYTLVFTILALFCLVSAVFIMLACPAKQAATSSDSHAISM